MAGQDPLAFPLVSLREVQVICEAAQRLEARRAWMAASYMRIAYHDPNNMPEDPGQPEKKDDRTDEIYVRAYLKNLASRSSDGS